jgi:hypothetical protein
MHSGLRVACLDAYKTKLDQLNKQGFSFEEDNPRLLIEVGTKEDQLMARLREYPSLCNYQLHAIFQELMEANNIRTLVLDDNNNIILPNGNSVRLSVFTKYCKDTNGTPFFDWQAINSFNLGNWLYLTIHPVDFANCSNQEDGITSWHSCFAHDGLYAGSPYAYINSPGTIMVMKGTPNNMAGRMWLHILYNDDGLAVGYCIMKAYGANFSYLELDSIRSAMSKVFNMNLVKVDVCDISTNNEMNSNQIFNVSSTDNDCYVFFDPISHVYIGRDFDEELHLYIRNPFDIYGDDIDCCDGDEFRNLCDGDTNSYCDCYHCNESFVSYSDQGTYLENYDRDVCNNCLDDLYTEIGDNYIWHEDVVTVYEVYHTRSDADSPIVDSYETAIDDIAIEYDNNLSEYVTKNCMHSCEDCGSHHADYHIYESLNVDFPCDETVEFESPRERETIEPDEFETEEIQIAVYSPAYYESPQTTLQKEA